MTIVIGSLEALYIVTILGLLALGITAYPSIRERFRKTR